jgi:hypothetical protein
LKTVIALILIAHGLVHAGLAAAPDPKDPDNKAGAFFTSAKRSWLLLKLGLSPITIQWIGIGLVSLATLGFVLAGLGIFGVPGLDTIWRVIAIVSAAISLLLLILFWHRWLVVGILIDLVILAELLWINWLPASVFYE